MGRAMNRFRTMSSATVLAALAAAAVLGGTARAQFGRSGMPSGGRSNQGFTSPAARAQYRPPIASPRPSAAGFSGFTRGSMAGSYRGANGSGGLTISRKKRKRYLPGG